MKVARFSHAGAIHFGIVDDTDVVVLDGDPMYSGFQPTGERIPLADVALISPAIPRSKVVGVLWNYPEVADDQSSSANPPSEPVIFLKPNTSVSGPGDRIALPTSSSAVEHEGELAVVIGSVAKNVRAADADTVIFGYTIANDVTARDLQEADGESARAKSFDTFCPVGPVIETEFDLSAATIQTRVNGAVRQSGACSDMLWGVPQLIEFVSSIFTLLPGDIVLTGSRAGDGAIRSGDTVEVEISGIGVLRNSVA